MTTLQDKLDEITARTRELVQAERLAVGERAVEELFASGIEERILPVGALAPEFELHDSRGRLVARPICLRWAVGGQILSRAVVPLLRDGVGNLERTLRATARARALMVAIGPQTERQNDFMVSQHRLPFAVLSDPGCALAEKFGVAYTVPEYLREYYLSILLNVPFVNGEASWRLPLPATL